MTFTLDASCTIPQNYGAVGNGIADDTAAFQAALAVGKPTYFPTGTYKITGSLPVFPAQKFYGDDRSKSVLSVSSVFPGGVISCSGGDPGPHLSDFGIAFAQPDTATRSALTVYPPAVNAQNTPRLLAERLLIQRATVGIDLTGASGGASITDIECSAFAAGVKIDGALDTMRLDKLSLNNYGLTANQTLVLQDPATYGLTVGRCDDFKLTNSLVMVGTALHAFTGALGSVGGEISATGFDTFNGIVMDSGELVIGNSYFSMKGSNYIAVYQTGGDLTLSGCRMNDSGTSGGGNACAIVANGAAFTWSGGTAFLGSQDRTLVKSFNAGTQLNLNGLTIFRNPNVAYSHSTLVKTAGDATITGCRMGNGPGSGSGLFIEIDVDGYDTVVGNAAHGFSNLFPTPVHGIYLPNG